MRDNENSWLFASVIISVCVFHKQSLIIVSAFNIAHGLSHNDIIFGCSDIITGVLLYAGE